MCDVILQGQEPRANDPPLEEGDEGLNCRRDDDPQGRSDLPEGHRLAGPKRHSGGRREVLLRDRGRLGVPDHRDAHVGSFR